MMTRLEFCEGILIYAVALEEFTCQPYGRTGLIPTGP